MKKLSLTPETLRVESFPTGRLEDAMAPEIVTGLPRRTCPECANSTPGTNC
ncbi:MAG: hypothetical protein JO306_01980 [Gemmatimonadetes bacterium]|nr:hypothetical protein [Gemmatimonadota bacterium]